MSEHKWNILDGLPEPEFQEPSRRSRPADDRPPAARSGPHSPSSDAPDDSAAPYLLTDEQYRTLMRSIEDNQSRLRQKRIQFESADYFRDLENVNDKLRRLDAVMKALKNQHWAHQRAS